MRAIHAFAVIAVLAVASPAFVACDDDGGTQGTTDTSTADTATTDTMTTDTGASPAQLTFRVVEPEFGDRPVDGAAVYFVPPGGEMTKVVTAADGLASFDEPEGWPDVTCSLHWYHPDYVYEGRVGISGADLGASGDGSAIALATTRLAGPLDGDIVFRGTLTGFDSIDHSFYVYTDTLHGEYEGRHADTFEVAVPPDTPFHWIAFEDELVTAPGAGIERGAEWKMHHAAVGESGGSATDVDVTIDFERDAATVKRAQISVPLVPEHPSGLATDGVVIGLVKLGAPSGWRPYTYSPFFPLDTACLAGWTERFGVEPGEDVASGGIAWIEPDVPADVRTVLRWSHPDADPLRSVVALRGYPVAGTQDVTFLEPALVLGAPWRWNQLSQWRNDEAGTWSVMTVGAAHGSAEPQGIKARIAVPPGVSELDLASLPADVDLFGGKRGFYILQADCGDGSYDAGCAWLRHTFSVLLTVDDPS